MPDPTQSKKKRGSFRWGHRRTSSTPVNIEREPAPGTILAAAAAAAASNGANDRRKSIQRSSSGSCQKFAPPTVEEEIEGLTAMTMISAEDGPGRPVSFANVDLPKMMYDSPQKAKSGAETKPPTPNEEVNATNNMLLRRTNSDPCNLNKRIGDNEESKQTLSYWKLEKEFRKAQDELLKRAEQVATLEQYKKTLTQEMDDLTTTLFEEAHEMVRIEKEARHKDHVLLEETRAKSAVLQEELKALKKLVASHAKDEKSMTRRASAAQLSNTLADEAPEASRPTDAVLFNEFMKWHIKPSLKPESDYMRRVSGEDLRPCLNFSPKTATLSKALLHSIIENTLVIEAVTGEDTAGVCAFSQIKRACTFRIKACEPLPEKLECDLDKEWLYVCTSTRNRIICVCNFFTYARYVVQGIVKANLTVVYWKLNEHRLQITKARLGMPLEDQS